MKPRPMTMSTMPVAVSPSHRLRTKFSSSGRPKAANEMRFYSPVPMFRRLVSLVFRSSVWLLYTASWNRQQ